VRNRGDLASLVRDTGFSGKPRRNLVVELLAKQNAAHLRCCLRRACLSLFDRPQDDREIACGRRVVQSLIEGLSILYTPQHLNTLGAQLAHGARHGFAAN